MKYKVLALVHLLQAKTFQTKSEAFRDLKIFYANYKDMLIYQKQFSAEKTLSDKVKKYASIVETCQKINRKYEEFCYIVRNHFLFANNDLVVKEEFSFT